MDTDRRQLKRAVLMEELVALTGDWLSALILNQMLYWQERRGDFDQFIAEEQQRDPSINMPLTHGWVWKTAEQICDELMLPANMRKTVSLRLRSLVDNKWIDRRNNPHATWDHTLQYRCDIRKIQQDLMSMGYVLDGYKISDFQSIGHSDQSIGHCDQTIPEITTETTEEERDHSTEVEWSAPFVFDEPRPPEYQTPLPTRHTLPPPGPSGSSSSAVVKKVPVSEKKRDNGADSAVSHKEMIAAICEVTGQTMSVKSVAGQVARASKDLRNAGLTPDQVRQFGAHWIANDWRGQRGDRPTVTQLLAGVDKFIKEGAGSGTSSRRSGAGLGAKINTAWSGSGGGGYSSGVPAGVSAAEYLASIIIPRSTAGTMAT